jgi:hypothetical protein
MVLGWMIGRLTGDITIPRESKLPSARVYDGESQSWQSFPNPLLGVRHQQELDAWTLLSAVLESMPLAIARCAGDPQFTELLAYRTLRQISELSNHVTNPTLSTWLGRGVGRSGNRNVFLEVGPSASPADRLASAQGWVDTVDLQFRTLLPKTHELHLPGSDLAELTPHNFERIKAPSSWELAPVIVAAAQVLKREFEEPMYQGQTGFVEPIG